MEWSGDGGQPDWLDDWIFGRFCEEGLAHSFNDALEQPYQACLDVLELRAFARAKQMVDGTDDESKLPDSPMIDLVFKLRDQRNREKLAARLAKVQRESTSG